MKTRSHIGLMCSIVLGIFCGCSGVGRNNTSSTQNYANISGATISKRSSMIIDQSSQGPAIVDCGDIELQEQATDNDGLQLEFDPKAFITGGVASPASGPVKLFVPRTRVAKSQIDAVAVNKFFARGTKISDDSNVEIRQGSNAGSIKVKGKAILNVTGKIEGKDVGAIEVSDKKVHENVESAKAAVKAGEEVIKARGTKNGKALQDLFLVAPIKK